MRVIAQEIDAETLSLLRRFAFDLDEGEAVSHRARSSLAAFNRRDRNKNKRLLYRIDPEGPLELGAPAEELHSLWHFYNKIGYDFKRRKYIR